MGLKNQESEGLGWQPVTKTSFWTESLITCAPCSRFHGWKGGSCVVIGQNDTSVSAAFAFTTGSLRQKHSSVRSKHRSPCVISNTLLWGSVCVCPVQGCSGASSSFLQWMTLFWQFLSCSHSLPCNGFDVMIGLGFLFSFFFFLFFCCGLTQAASLCWQRRLVCVCCLMMSLLPKKWWMGLLRTIIENGTYS